MESKRLLVVDDHAGMREFFVFHMHRANFLVDEAEDGLQALESIEKARPDLIVLDLMMPKLDGRGVLRELRELGLTDIPVIVVTGYSEAFNREAILAEPNVKAYLAKPIKYAELEALIRELLGPAVPAAGATH